MSSERDIDIDTVLMPVRAASIVETDGKIPPKIKRINCVVSALGRRITEDLPAPWTKFIADAMNKYFESIEYPKEKDGRTVASLIIMGEPRTREESRQIRQNSKGEYELVNTPRFMQWVNKAKKELYRSWIKKPSMLPLTDKYIVRAKFYVTPNKNPQPLPNLCAGILECLKQLGIFKETHDLFVGSMDGSRVIVDGSEPRTEIVIRKFWEITE